MPKLTTTTTTDQHHKVQVAQLSVQFSRQWLDEETPQAYVAEGDTTKCECGLSALMTE